MICQRYMNTFALPIKQQQYNVGFLCQYKLVICNKHKLSRVGPSHKSYLMVRSEFGPKLGDELNVTVNKKLPLLNCYRSHKVYMVSTVHHLTHVLEC